MAALFPAGASDVLYIVDLSSYVLRAYHAIAPLTSPSGEPTHAVHGTVSMIERLLRERQPALVAIALDSGRATFRKELYPAYKENRPPAPDDLKRQLERTGQIVRAYGLAVFQQGGVEADDLIATTVRRAREQGLRVVIVGADKDLMQLVADDVLLWDTMRDRVFGVAEVEERFGVRVDQLGDLLALVGDPSDNIPGVPSVGPKTAKDLLNEYGTIDGIYSHLDAIPKKKLKETLAAHREAALLSRRLVTLKDDCDLAFDRDALAFHGRDTHALEAIYRELGFQRQLALLAKEAQAGASSGAAPAAQVPTPSSSSDGPERGPTEVSILETVADLEAFLERVKERRFLCLECHGVRAGSRGTELVGLALGTIARQAAYLPLAHRALGAQKTVSADAALARLRPVLGDPAIEKAAFDLKREAVLLGAHGLTFAGGSFDLHLALYLDDPEAQNDLAALATSVLSSSWPSYEEITEKRRGHQLDFDQVAVEAAANFAGARVDAVARLSEPLLARLDAQGLSDLYRNVEVPLVFVLADLERNGILLDKAKLAELATVAGAELEVLEKRAIEVAGRAFNVQSPRQLETILFDELHLKPIKRTKTSRSTDAETLEALSEQHALPGIVLEHRQLSKLKGTYIDTLPKLADRSTGRVHTQWEQAVAATGRLSSTDPNLQNIPIRTAFGRKIREAFIAPPGSKLVSADYSQIELRVLAHLSNDEVLIDAFERNQDIHARTAMEVFEVPASDVSRELRARAKAVNFGVIYGQGDTGLAKSLGISRAEAGSFIAAYFRRYRGVQRFMAETLENARLGGAVRSLLGRRRLLPDIRSGNRARRLAAERIAMNMPIQGTAADLLKLAMLALKDPVTPGARMLLSVHDELVFEVPDPEVSEASEKIRQAMEGVYRLRVPLVVDVGSGQNWNAAH